MMMVAAIVEDPTNPKPSLQRETLQSPRRSRTSFSDNGLGSNPRKPRIRDVPSRYLSPLRSLSSSSATAAAYSSSRRCPSPMVSKTPPAALPKRAQSVDCRQPQASSAAAKLISAATSPSVSLEAAAAGPLYSNRKGTPERWRSTTTTTPSRTKVDDHRWPGTHRQATPLSVSLDSGKVIRSGATVRNLKQSRIGESTRTPFDGRLSLDLSRAELLRRGREGSSTPSDLTASDTDSISSGSTSGTQQDYNVTRRRSMAGLARLWQGTNTQARRVASPLRRFPRDDFTASDTDSVSSGSTSTTHEYNVVSRGIKGTSLPRLWPETNARLQRQDQAEQLTPRPRYRNGTPRRVMLPKQFPGDDLSLEASLRGMSSPMKAAAAARPASPSRTIGSSRGSPSPSRVRNAVSGTPSSLNSSCSAPSVLSFSVDVRRGRMGDKNRSVDAHLLRLLHNKHLQWRFVTARAEAATFKQRRSIEKMLWNASIAISELRRSVRVKRVELQLLRQKLKLFSILKGQLNYLEEWALLDREHSISLMGAIEALKASTLRLPLVGGAIAEIGSVKKALGSAANVMQAMSSSICSVMIKVTDMNSLATELANTTTKERALLGQCAYLLSTSRALQVKDNSLSAHKLQLITAPKD